MPQDHHKSDTHTVVVGVDGSDHSRQALKWAADEAKRRGALLRIIFAEFREPKNLPAWYEPGSSDLSPGQAIVDDAYGLVATRHTSVMARAEVAESPPALALTAGSRSAELLVLGARGKGGFEELLLGSVSDRCIQHACCPVVVVHTDPDDRPLRAVPPRIVVGIDGSVGSTPALRWALDEARLHSASVEAVHVWQYPPTGAFAMGPVRGHDMFSREIIEAAQESAETWAPEVPFTATARSDGTVPALLDASRGADLLVVGSRGHAGFKHALLGSVAHQCARHAKCAVVITRPRVAEEASEATPQVNGETFALHDAAHS
jgi:nucleotide-binding universal stress UspA family protein